jgi:non-specific serine/threonine protein kinase
MNRTPERIGKYRIIREIGRGATAVVYLAESADYPAPVALKHVRFDDKIKDEAKWNRRVIKLLKAERVVSGRLNHPNIIRLLAIHESRRYRTLPRVPPPC